MKKKIIPGVILLLVTGIIIYLCTYYKAQDNVNEYIKNGNDVTIEKIDVGYYFDGPGKNNAIIFYPGAKVEYISYAPLMYALAQNNIDCFLIKMPFNIAFFGTNKASKIINKYEYSNWYISGHSLGGVVASNYLSNNSNKFKGIIFLASYSTKEIDSNIDILSIYGSQDGVINMNSYSKNKKNWNDTAMEVIIDGGNHAYFGYYGEQNGDNKALISREEQQKQTVKAIIDYVDKS